MVGVELQVFVSLVVVLGAAFVALICDFLKGNNEQLRESNIELRVRQSEREQREEIMDRVQRQAIEALVQARVPSVPANAPAPPPPPRADDTVSFELAQLERSMRRHDIRRQQQPPTVTEQPITKPAVAAPPRIETLRSLPLPLGIVQPQAFHSAPASSAVDGDSFLPKTGLSMDKPTYEIVDAIPPAAAPEQTAPYSPVVRIRVLTENDFLPTDECGAPPPAAPLAGAEPISLPAPIHAPLAVATLEPVVANALMTPAIPVARIETTFFAEPLQPPAAALEDTAVAEEDIPAVETRSNVLEMPAAPVIRSAEPTPPIEAELVIPGGFHDTQVLARLLEDETPFKGLAIVISVVDYVRLMADQGKPAAEQLLGSISRLVMSLAREQDFACRIAEDEFVVLFADETGTAAKRRIQLVSERLWDFQLRSLGTVSVIFSWGASESTNEALVHSVEYAREQMLESRRNRRALASGVGRFRRRVANS